MSHFNQSQAISVTPTEAILESISDGVFTVDLNWRITSFNRAAETITGIPREEAIGRLCSEVFRSNMCETDCALCHTLDDGRPVIDKSGYIIDADGRRIPISVSTAVLRDGRGEVIGAAETFRDLSEVEALRKELQPGLARIHRRLFYIVQVIENGVRFGDFFRLAPGDLFQHEAQVVEHGANRTFGRQLAVVVSLFVYQSSSNLAGGQRTLGIIRAKCPISLAFEFDDGFYVARKIRRLMLGGFSPPAREVVDAAKTARRFPFRP